MKYCFVVLRDFFARCGPVRKGRRVAALLFWGLWLALLLSAVPAVALPEKGISFDAVKDRAQQLVQEPYDAEAGLVPQFLWDVNYDAWRDIRFRPAKALWKDENLPFQVQLFHPGGLFKRAVAINIVDAQGVSQVSFSTALFEYEKTSASLKDSIPADMGFAGFRLHYPINTPNYYDEVIVFLGASYFRAVAGHSNYGLSARGCSINTYVDGETETFPYFREFWLVKPRPGAKEITIYALLDGASISGAYQFVVKPGKDTVVEVKSTLFLRKKVVKLGIAPLTSMFFYGENTNQPPVNDFRPEVHDSDGLQITMGTGEWVWRPLKNPGALINNWFHTINPKGFGLFQRDRDFDHYQDLEAHYEKRPSAWIKTLGTWGEGWVELIQTPSVSEYADNINVLWVPATLPEPGQPISFNYQMNWHYSQEVRHVGARVVATRTADGRTPLARKFIVDFEGGLLPKIPANRALTAVVTVDSRVRLVEQQLQKNDITNGWRLVFEVNVDSAVLLEKILEGKEPAIELRAFLKDGEEVLSETWTYAIQP